MRGPCRDSHWLSESMCDSGLSCNEQSAIRSTSWSVQTYSFFNRRSGQPSRNGKDTRREKKHQMTGRQCAGCNWVADWHVKQIKISSRWWYHDDTIQRMLSFPSILRHHRTIGLTTLTPLRELRVRNGTWKKLLPVLPLPLSNVLARHAQVISGIISP